MTTVLIVDDEAAITDLLADLIGEFGYEPLTASNGKEALQLLAALPEPPALLLTDLMMPKMNGMDLVAALRADPRTRHIPVLVMTAAPAALREGLANATIKKPFDLARLMDTVQALLPAQHHGEEVL